MRSLRVEVTFGKDDAERYGVPVVVGDTTELDIGEMIEVQETTGLNIVTLHTHFFEGDAIAMKTIVWIGLRQAGKPVPFEDLKFKVYSAKYRHLPGKEEAEEKKTPSARKSTSSPRPSRKSSGSTRGTSNASPKTN